MRIPSDTGRFRRVAEMAAEKSGWGKRKLGKGIGLGHRRPSQLPDLCGQRWSKVEVDPGRDFSIPRVDTVVDAGLVVNPEATRAQVRRSGRLRNQHC